MATVSGELLTRCADALAPLRAAFLVDGPALQAVDDRLTAARRACTELEAERLVVGLLGGTGVGKSTLLNALAEADISRPGDRRPTTSRIVCYRHGDFPQPEWLAPGDLAAPGPLPHQRPALRGVVLLDLPDIDSTAREHRALVHRVLPLLDLLLVVTSVDKYGDQVLYDELSALPQAPRNLVFVLNAMDRLRPDDRALVRADFERKLRENAALHEPEVLAISARAACRRLGRSDVFQPGDAQDTARQPDSENGDTGDFDALRALLDRLGGAQERHAVLHANAATACERFLHAWDEFLPAARYARWHTALAELPADFPAPGQRALDALADALEERLGPHLREPALRASWFPIGPIHYFTRRLRPRPAALDPFREGGDPIREFTATHLERPLRVAEARLAEILSTEPERLRFAVRSKPPPPVAEALAPWADHLRGRAARWRWRWLPHLPPVALVAAWILGSLTRTARAATESVWQAAGRGLVELCAALTPAVLIGVGVFLVGYYALVYPYYLYRLARRVRAAAEDGAKITLHAWREAFAQAWGTTLRDERERLDTAWKHLETPLAALRGRDGSSA